MTPYLHYHCPCLSKAPETPPDENQRGYSLAHLYYCEECNALRCPRCIISEIVTYYCPHCLFEVPGASVRSERNRCSRNCFACPICQAVMSVTNDGTEKQSNMPSFWLSCSACRWDSRSAGIIFDKPTGLALKVQKIQDSKIAVQEFDRIKEHYDKYVRSVNLAHRVYNPITHTHTVSSPIFMSSRFGGTLTSSSPNTTIMETNYEPGNRSSSASAIKEDSKSLIEKLRYLSDIDEITTMTQRCLQIDNDMSIRTLNLTPLRVLLRAKTSLRCLQCRHILIKPEQKAQSTRFKIKLTAFLCFPNIHVYPPTHPLRSNRSFHAVLKFSNPLLDEINVSLATHCDPLRGKVTVVAPSFTVAPFNEVWEYDEEDMDDHDGLRRGAKSEHGIVERKGNSTSVLLEINISKVQIGEMFSFPLLVTFSYKAEDGGEETSFLFWTTVGLGCIEGEPNKEVDMID